MIDIIFFAAFAAFMAFRLYKVLGSRDFGENRPNKDNVVNFPVGDEGKVVDLKAEIIDEDYAALEKKHGTEVVARIKEIKACDPSFTEQNFLMGSGRAFEIIVNAFSKGDKKILKNLLSKEIYKGFSDEIDRRKNSERIEEVTLVSVIASKIRKIILDKKYAKIVVEIVSEQINVVKDAKGKIIEGNPSQVDKLSEEWTFGRNLASSDPNWELVAIGGVK